MLSPIPKSLEASSIGGYITGCQAATVDMLAIDYCQSRTDAITFLPACNRCMALAW